MTSLLIPAVSCAVADFDEAIERIDPDVMLVDRYIDRMLRNARDPSHVNHHLYLGFEAFVSRRHASISCVIRDRSYGDMRVYLVPRRSRQLTDATSDATEGRLHGHLTSRDDFQDEPTHRSEAPQAVAGSRRRPFPRRRRRCARGRSLSRRA